MGTNYYAVRKEPSVYNRAIHLGKTSHGWLFLFQEQDDIHTFPQFRRWLETHVDTGEYVILDEYDRALTTEDLLDLIDWYQNDEFSKSNPDNFEYDCKNINGYRFTEREFW